MNRTLQIVATSGNVKLDIRDKILLGSNLLRVKLVSDTRPFIWMSYFMFNNN